MYSKRIWKFVGTGVVIAALAVVFFIAGRDNNVVTEATDQVSDSAASVVISVEGVFNERAVAIASEQTVLAVLAQLDDTESRLQLIVKEYPGLGVLVESMNGKTNGADDKYWQYTVNGVMPEVGADALQLHDGDVVEWHFTSSEF